MAIVRYDPWATMNQLEVRIPKMAKVQPRRITVES